ncbi:MULTISPECIES: class I SAM-dependent methyltransferase [unclassified Aurantimonas]|uniref:class I SAM-dependent methyltransferase n=1 Tax=unclassified Aurantimonas TaxID=2638230 RepID=UPI002E18E37E|nr:MULTISPECIES: methyltransferase domain-containing protein [unclassified Aurantimonas]MEC5289362.1 methyltransferase domain-containing protein [Aurantimonas sp. C2-3-R2]MEC5410442.1 methyltransferase domain-containing protein [Aurantimonas sp. C2-4-R8]
MADFFLETVQKAGVQPEDTVLVVCGGSYDQQTLEVAGVKDVVISNVSDRGSPPETYGNYRWEIQDAEDISHPDQSFDWVIVHAGLHHCRSPHRGFCEMLRVSTRGIIIVEARDSLVVGAAKRLGLVPEFEMEPIILSGGKYGGVRDTPIPNFIYRWTEKEARKTVASFDPAFQHQVLFNYGWRLPLQRISMSRNRAVRAAVRLADAGKFLLTALLPHQGNLFGIVVKKSGEVRPWIKRGADNQMAPDLDYIGKKYDPSRYSVTGHLPVR